MKNFIERITKWIKNNKTMAVWIVAIAILVTVFIYNLISNAVETGTTTLIDLPLPTNSEITIKVPKGTYEDLDLKNKPTEKIFYAQEFDYRAQVEVFLARIGKTNLQRADYVEIMTTWSDGQDFIQYSVDESEIFFRFIDPVEVPDLELGYINIENGADTIAEVVRAFTGNVYTYTNVKVKEELGEFRIEANRDIDGVRIERPGVEEFSDYLVLTANGEISEGRFFVATISDTSLKVNLIHPSNLQGIISTEIYPKEVAQGYARSITAEDYEDSTDTEVAEFRSVTLESLAFPKAAQMETEELEVVYYFSNHNYPEIFPVYKLQGTGEVTYKGKEYVVPLFVYANAIDPDLVYIPGEVDEPTPDL